MASPEVTAYGSLDGRAEVQFDDGLTLALMPRLKRQEVAGIERAALERDGTPVAEARRDGKAWVYSGTEYGPGEMAARVEAGVTVERAVYAAYRAGRIPRDEWAARYRDFWKISIKCRPLLAALEQGRVARVEPNGAADEL